MSEQRFPAGANPRVRISRVSGDLRVTVWDEEAILVSADAVIRELYQEDDEVVIADCDDDLELHLPARTALHLEECNGDMHVTGLRSVTAERVNGDFSVNEVSEQLQAGQVGGDLDLQVAADAEVRLSDIGGDLRVKGAAKLQAGQIGGDCTLTSELLSSVQLGNVGGDLRVGLVHTLHVANVGGDLAVERSLAALTVGNLGGDARLGMVEGNLELGAVGGDLSFAAHMAPGSRGRAQVGGDVRLSLGEAPNLSLRAMVAGDVRGGAQLSADGPTSLSLRYGEGAASLELTVGGDLQLSGGPDAEASSWAAGSEIGANWAEFGREMGELGRELGRLGRELGDELSAAFGAATPRGSTWDEEAAQRGEEAAQRGEQRAQRWQAKAEARARRSAAKARPPRMHLRVNTREWQLDPERIERIKEQARQAAAEGLSGALEAVERAVSRLRIPPVPPTPEAPPGPDAPPAPTSPAAPVTGQTIRIEAAEGPAATAPPEPVTAASREQERESILRMIAEGRISPDEGDMLLEALEA
jgi:hypothetical protein